MKKLSILIITIFLLAGCAQKADYQQITLSESAPEEKTEAENKFVSDTVKLEEMKLNGSRHITEKVGCNAEISYPKILIGDGKVINNINDTIDDAVINTFLYYAKMDWGIEADTLSEALDKYLDVCFDQLKNRIEIQKQASLDQIDLSKYNILFYQKLNYEVTLNQNALLSLHFDLINEYGGAHPIYWTSVLNFDLKTGKLLGFDDIFYPEKLDEFYRFEKEKLVENKMRDRQFVEIEKALETETPLPEEFQLKAFYLTPEGVSSVYQDYEVTGHGDGPPSLTIPYKDLKDFIKEDGPLAVFLED